MSRAPKSVRIGEQQQQMLDALLAQFPDVTSEADLIYRALVEGLYVLAAQATVPERGPLYGGRPAKEVAGHLERHVLAQLPFLIQHGTVVQTLLGQLQQLGLLGAAPGGVPVEPAAPAPPFDPDAQRDSEALGADFV